MLARRVARPLLASIFIVGGWDAMQNPESKTPAAGRLLGDRPSRWPLLEDTEQLVRADGAVKVAAGIALGLNRVPRLAALTLCASLVPTTLAGHRFWAESDDAQRAAQQLHFVKNAAILGGLILAAVDTEGRPSVGWRARKAARQVADQAAAGEAALLDKFR
jgi:putative oxidoreductase